MTIPHQEFQTLAPQVLIAAKEAVLNDPSFGLGETYLQRKRALFGCPADDTTCEGGGGLRIYVTVDYGLQQQAQALAAAVVPAGHDRADRRHRHGGQPHRGHPGHGFRPGVRRGHPGGPAHLRHRHQGPAQPRFGLQAVRAGGGAGERVPAPLVLGGQLPPDPRLRRRRALGAATAGTDGTIRTLEQATISRPTPSSARCG